MKDDITIFIDTDTTNEKELISNFEKNILEEKKEDDDEDSSLSTNGTNYGNCNPPARTLRMQYYRDEHDDEDLVRNTASPDTAETPDEQEQIRTPISQLGVRAWMEQWEKEHEVRKKSDDLLEDETRILRHSARRR